MEKYNLILKGNDCGFSWSASHLLPGHYKCSRMHGHNYVLDVKIESDKLEHGMLIDFVTIKKEIRKMIEKYDHKLLLPEMSNTMKIEKEDGMDLTIINYTLDDDNLNESTAMKIKIDPKNPSLSIKKSIFINKRYGIPSMDIEIIPMVEYVTAEELSKHFFYEISNILTQIATPGYYNVSTTIYEDAGQGATYTSEMKSWR
jgi:6-pyruvoyl tetrahydropterin synthase/QueD family protein